MSNAPIDLYITDDQLPDREVIENSGVNVLYLVNTCNLACTYCYESLESKKKYVLSIEQLEKNIDSIIEREGPDQQTLFVLFGGEPTLVMDKAIHAMNYALSKKSNCRFNLTSNGIKFLDDDFARKFKDSIPDLGKFSLDISFDGSGNGERIYHDGRDSTSDMLKVFAQLSKFDINWRLRYTINKANIDTLVSDIVDIHDKFHPERLITSVAWNTLIESDGDFTALLSAKETFRFMWQNGSLTSPVCEMFCDICDGCSIKKSLKVYFTDKGEVTRLGNNENATSFNDFEQKK
jgi:sulfatase maturation enzyme AslB (radical SAM superfamily)